MVETLQSLLLEGGSFKEHDAANWIYQILLALDEMQTAKLMHLNLVPENIQVD